MDSGPIRILLIEDSPADQILIEEALNSTKLSYELSTVGRLSEAIEALTDETEVVLADLYLPDSDGLDTVTSLHAARPETPIVVLTGQPADGLRCIQAGAHDYMAKGDLDSIALHRAVSYAIERRRRTEAEMERLVAQYRDLASEERGKRPAGEPPLRDRDPAAFASVHARYCALLDAYITHLSVHHPKPHREMDQLIAQLGAIGAGPRELVDVHLSALESMIPGVSGERGQAFAREGRLLALEVMGRMADYYREDALNARSRGLGR